MAFVFAAVATAWAMGLLPSGEAPSAPGAPEAGRQAAPAQAVARAKADSPAEIAHKAAAEAVPTPAPPGAANSSAAAEAARADPGQGNVSVNATAANQAGQDPDIRSYPTEDPLATVRSSRVPDEEGGLSLWTVILTVVAGLLGGLVGWLLGGGFRRDVVLHLQDLKTRVASLEKFRESARAQIDRLGTTPGAGHAPPPPARSLWTTGNDIGDAQSVVRGQREETPRQRPPLSLETTAAQYNQLVQGNISRSAFDTFFGQFGTAAPADIVDNGRFIQPSVHDDSLLTAVAEGKRALVFPSYAFIANSDTLFTTMASAPGPIQHLFDLSKGGGGLTLDRPALFEDKGSGLELVRKGALRGFQG